LLSILFRSLLALSMNHGCHRCWYSPPRPFLTVLCSIADYAGFSDATRGASCCSLRRHHAAQPALQTVHPRVRRRRFAANRHCFPRSERCSVTGACACDSVCNCYCCCCGGGRRGTNDEARFCGSFTYHFKHGCE